MIGSKLGKYEILEEIGRGGMGRVYKAHQPSLDRAVAVKVLMPHLAADEVFVERFLREARSIANLAHPGIVTIYDVGESGGTYYFAMQLLDGKPLDDLLEESGSLPVETAAKIVQEVARALDFAHRVGILHRDVKPGNIIVTAAGAVLTDFGIAQALTDPRLTKTGTSIGSPEYMAPEQIEGKPLDARTDLYALGVVLYQMLTGKLPYKGETPMAIVYQHVKAPVPAARELDPKIPEWIDQIATRLMAKRPEDRYGSARELLDDLLDESPSPRAGRRRGKGLAWVGVAAAAAGLFLGAVYWRGSAPRLDDLLGTAAPVEAEAEVAPEAPAAGGEPTPRPGGAATPAAELAAAPRPEPPAAADVEPAPPPLTETLRVTSNPPGATVILDGETLERPTPAEIELLPETGYRLGIRLEGYEPAGLEFTLDDLSASQRSSGQLHFPLRSSIPPGAVSIAADYPVEIVVDGRTFTGDRVELPPGTYDALVSAPSVYFSETRRLIIESGETRELALPMAKTITIAANPSRCRVKIDGRDAGYVPAEVRVTVGPHLFEFDWESMGETRSITRNVTAQTDRIFATPSG